MENVLAIILGLLFGYVLYWVGASSPKKLIAMLRLQDLSIMKIIVFGIGFASVLLSVFCMLGLCNTDHLSVKGVHLGAVSYTHLDSRPENEGLARMVISAFVSRLDPTLEELADIKTAVSEAVTNCVIHGYNNGPGKIHMNARIQGKIVTVEIIDHGVGIENVEKAMEPLFTTKPELDQMCIRDRTFPCHRKCTRK